MLSSKIRVSDFLPSRADQKSLSTDLWNFCTPTSIRFFERMEGYECNKAWGQRLYVHSALLASTAKVAEAVGTRQEAKSEHNNGEPSEKHLSPPRSRGYFIKAHGWQSGYIHSLSRTPDCRSWHAVQVLIQPSVVYARLPSTISDNDNSCPCHSGDGNTATRRCHRSHRPRSALPGTAPTVPV